MNTQYYVKNQTIVKETRKRRVSKGSVNKWYQKTEAGITKARTMTVV